MGLNANALSLVEMYTDDLIKGENFELSRQISVCGQKRRFNLFVQMREPNHCERLAAHNCPLLFFEYIIFSCWRKIKNKDQAN